MDGRGRTDGGGQRAQRRERRGEERGTVNLHKFDILGESGASALAIPVASSLLISPLSVFRSKSLSPAAASRWSTNILAVNMADISLEGRRIRERD